MTELERDMKERIERLTREIEARNAACKQYAYDIACLTDKVRALQVKIDNLTMRTAAASGVALVPGVIWISHH
jgi:hypothetical protein